MCCACLFLYIKIHWHFSRNHITPPNSIKSLIPASNVSQKRNGNEEKQLSLCIMVVVVVVASMAASTPAAFFRCNFISPRLLFYFSYFVDDIIYNVRYISFISALSYGSYHNFNENFMSQRWRAWIQHHIIKLETFNGTIVNCDEAVLGLNMSALWLACLVTINKQTNKRKR